MWSSTHEETRTAGFTRGFSGRRRSARDPRLPPGQYDTGDSWPVLTAEATPRLDTASWTFKVEGLVKTPTTWTWDEIRALPGSVYEGDIHCVTDKTPVNASAPSPWSPATVVAIRRKTPTAKTFRLRLSHPSHHTAGQHYIIRLTAPDGYSASRSYSVASAPDASEEIEITVERLPNGEVSSFLHDDVVTGDELEVRGPIGGWFVWSGESPALLIGGGSGVVPLMAMLRLARSTGASDLVRLVVSVRNRAGLYYATELPGPETTIVYTRQRRPSDGRPPGHLTTSDFPTVRDDAPAYVCGSSPFADAASDLIIALGLPTERVRVERFGPTS